MLCSLSLVHTCSSCFPCFYGIPAPCITYLELLTNLEQFYFCLLCSARDGGYKYACVEISSNVGVSTFLLDSHRSYLPLWWLFTCIYSLIFPFLSLPRAVSIVSKNHSSFSTCIFCSYHFSRQDHPTV